MLLAFVEVPGNLSLHTVVAATGGEECDSSRWSQLDQASREDTQASKMTCESGLGQLRQSLAGRGCLGLTPSYVGSDDDVASVVQVHSRNSRI